MKGYFKVNKNNLYSELFWNAELVKQLFNNKIFTRKWWALQLKDAVKIALIDNRAVDNRSIVDDVTEAP